MFERKKVAMIAAEVLATAMLTMGILAITKSAIGIPYFVALGAGLTLAVITMLFVNVSGAHANPAITLGQWTVRKIDTGRAVVYIAAQFLGAVMAWQLYVYLVDRTLQNIAGKEFDWRVLVAEMVGTFVLSFGIAAVTFGKQDEKRMAAAIVGGSFALGIMAAGVASNALLNPAVALGVQSWSIAYVVGPVIGSVIGMNLFAMLFAPESALSFAKPVASKSVSKSRKTAKPAKSAAKSSARRKK
ncbi:aquaporin [Candidatus Saccharibacteria bacterium]|nr:aquaporin [Candidatus Saccharibacteria bacterium]MCA9337142.1 aquaporin [Candidatus Saccharibacteria bacterium]